MFQRTLVQYSITSILCLFCASLYFIERKNGYSRKHLLKVKDMGSQDVMAAFRSCVGAKKMLIYIFIIFSQTLMIFPGVTNNIELSFIDTRGKWFQLIMVSIFGLFDTIGRYIGGIWQIQNLGFPIFLRSFLIVFAIFCAQNQIKGYDILKMANLIIFGFSNGYLQTICCCRAPKNVENK